MRLPAALTLGALAATLAACASSRADPAVRGQALLSTAPPPAGRECHLLPPPPFHVHPALLVDSAALVEDLEPIRERLVGRYAILSLQVDEVGRNARREIIEDDLPTGMADTVRARVFNHLRQLAPGEPWGARLRIDFAEQVRLRVGRQELCPARLRTPNERVGALDLFDVRSTGRAVVPAQLNTVWIRVDVAPSGVVTDVRMQPPLVPIRYETPLLNFVRALAFDAAILDGIPIASSTMVPIRIR
jgi:hypothetical protein